MIRNALDFWIEAEDLISHLLTIKADRPLEGYEVELLQTICNSVEAYHKLQILQVEKEISKLEFNDETNRDSNGSSPSCT